MSTVGFIGLGNMGGPMAANLVAAGYMVRGFDLVPAALEAARRSGVEIVSSAEDAGIGADTVITMLPSGQHVLDVYRSPLMKTAGPGTLFLECSTIDVASSRIAHEIVTRNGMQAVDAPVSGGVAGAVNGTLTFMLGGPDEAVRRATPILSAMGRKVVHCGPAGSGQAAKICNNLILGSTMIAACEGFLLGQALGLSAQTLFDVTSTSSAQCWAITTYCPVAGPVPTSPANQDYVPGFSAKLMLKDLDLARQAAKEAGVTLPFSRHARDLFAAFEAAGNGSKDFSGIIEYIRTEEM
ncbi:MAG: 3-hydroxyisobutyrate dehydrogenase [Acidobacteriaceae bacterium]